MLLGVIFIGIFALVMPITILTGLIALWFAIKKRKEILYRKGIKK